MVLGLPLVLWLWPGLRFSYGNTTPWGQSFGGFRMREHKAEVLFIQAAKFRLLAVRGEADTYRLIPEEPGWKASMMPPDSGRDWGWVAGFGRRAGGFGVQVLKDR
jgi:hypothetical protein